MKSSQEEKKQLRKEHLAIRNAMSEEERLSKSHEIMESVVSSYDFLRSEQLLIYASYGSEVNTTGIIEYAFLLKKKVYCPKVTGDGEMEFYRIDSQKDLIPGYKGIPEPAVTNTERYEPDSRVKAMVVMPGVCFDEKGNRIGYGKGFYDRYLAHKDGILKMALAFDNQVTECVPEEEADISYDLLVTEFQTICLLEDD